MIGIIFAMEEEIAALKKFLSIKEEKQIYDLTFYEGTIFDKEIVLVKSGVGKVNASRTTQILIDNYKVKYVLNVGVAGGIDQKLDILDLVIGTGFIQHDFDITAFNHKKGYVPNLGDILINDDEIINIAYNSFNDTKHKVFKGIIASGDIFVTDKKIGSRINNEFDALCIEMESAAVAQTCYLCNVPYLIVRSISDVPGKNNLLSYEEFLEKSCCVVAEYVVEIIKNIK